MSLLGILGTLLAVIGPAAASCSTDSYYVETSWSICNWLSPRVNIVHDIVYIDGGDLVNQLVYSNNCTQISDDDNYSGYVYTLDLSKSWNTSSNFSNVMGTLEMAGGGGSNVDPTYVDGVLFANDNEWIGYGGQGVPASNDEVPSGDEVLGYEAYQGDSDIQDWNAMWWTTDLPDNVTNYITNGAGVSAPSENMGFYFSGMHAPGWESFTWPATDVANITADTFVTVNMTVMRSEVWDNVTLPSNIQGRANAELVWVPVSTNGVVVAIGGVINPAELYIELSSEQETESKDVSPGFMEQIPVYDVGTQTWYLQNTTGDTPPQLTQFCSVLASASDGSSHNIYIYGGYNGYNYASNPYDDVYILSLPSFKWVKAYNGTTEHARMGHRCVKPYPDQMLSIAGMRIDTSYCLDGGIITTFNLNNLTFQDTYDPSVWSEYKVPDILIAEIGGDASGGATTTSPGTWDNSSLAGIFDTKYTKTITSYYPYNTTTTTDTSTSSGGKGFAKWKAAVIGVLVGLFVVGLIVVGLWFWLRRRQRRELEKEPRPSEADGTERLTSMYGGGPVSPVAGPQSVSTGQETSLGAYTGHESVSTSVSPGTVESGGGIVHEMHDSSPVELPTQFNNTSTTTTAETSDFARGSSPSPISPQTPDTESGHSFLAGGVSGHHRTLSTRSIDNVVSARLSHFQESFDGTTTTFTHKHQGSEVSEISGSSNAGDRTQINETIHENE
ncbi:hypothetical protein N7493_006656 [Penicillium malachiteum]|uniref:Galactose oxidase/kelch, beta-propeller n=1 Tax=Penicillium malachiteum TaxID=1324776 RepID=A0AAD6HLP7_9EURO|nr:hypothetical protein N7493_006656 [Penicillium malachiteum]